MGFLQVIQKEYWVKRKKDKMKKKHYTEHRTYPVFSTRSLFKQKHGVDQNARKQKIIKMRKSINPIRIHPIYKRRRKSNTVIMDRKGKKKDH